MSLGVHLEVATGHVGLEPFLAEWDALAVACAEPFCAPAFLLGWWRHRAPYRARLAIGLVFDAGRMIGVAPTFLRGRWGPRVLLPLATGACFGVTPLAAAGRQQDVAAGLAALFGQADRPSAVRADLIRFEGITAGSRWPELLVGARSTPGRPWVAERKSGPAHEIDISDGPGGWLASRTSRFRRQLRNYTTAFADEGGRVSVVTGPARARAIADIVRLHENRWRDHGGSHVAGPGTVRWLQAAAAGLDDSRLRIVAAHVGGDLVAGTVLLAAGGEVGGWITAYDPLWAKHSLGMLLTAEVVRDAEARGDRRFDLGPGTQNYKDRLATGQHVLRWADVVPAAGPRSALARTAVRGTHGAARLGRRIPAERREPILRAGRAGRAAIGRLPRGTAKL